MRVVGLAVAAALVAFSATAAENRPWDEILAKAKGQTVHFNAWAGDERGNAFIAWIGEETAKRYGVSINHVKLKDTAEAVTRVVSEKSAGRDQGGSVDLIWINGPNFLSMKSQGLLYGPVTQALPNYRYVDTTSKRSNLIDFTVPVDGMEVPWRMAQIVYVHDSARLKPAEAPKSIPDLLAWAEKNPGRLTHPAVRNFLGSTFLKQALYELTRNAEVLQQPATDENFAAVTAPLWAWYDKLKPHLWRGGQAFPDNGPAMRQLLNDGEIDLMISFNPAEAAVSIINGSLPNTARVYVMSKGTIGNTSFVAIPYNAANKEGAMVVANFLLEPATQARAQDPKVMGNFTVLDPAKLPPESRRLFDGAPEAPGLPSNAELGAPLLEPHASWMTRITAEWEKRYTR